MRLSRGNPRNRQGGKRGVRLPFQQTFAMKEEAVTNLDFVRKRKISGEFNMMDPKIFTCQHSTCPYSQAHIGFPDRASRDTHQLSCPYRGSSSSDFGGPSFHANEVKPVIYPPQSFVQPKPMMAQSVNMVPPSIDITGLGVSEDGEKSIGGLMTVYDSGNHLAATENHILPQASSIQQLQQQNYFRGQGMVMEGNMFEATNMSNNNHHHMFARDEGQFDQRFKALNSPFENNHNHNQNHNNNFHLMFGSPPHCDLTSYEFKGDMHGVGIMDHLQKQPDISSVWYQ
uniref:Uncharacterized protein n=1 Tax=Medicago truncatula TaxID=3880 RepID=B7FLS6_MEDTR|nr:unknown [Medicago truncatula]AFK45814.1 unknown [Medicago truncatula]